MAKWPAQSFISGHYNVLKLLLRYCNPWNLFYFQSWQVVWTLVRHKICLGISNGHLRERGIHAKSISIKKHLEDNVSHNPFEDVFYGWLSHRSIYLGNNCHCCWNFLNTYINLLESVKIMIMNVIVTYQVAWQ